MIIQDGLDKVLAIPPTIRIQSKTSTAFLPTDITGLQLWLDANDLATLWQDSGRTTAVASDGDPVGAWDDKSGNSRHCTQATSSRRPTYKTAIQNSLPVIRWDGTDDTMDVGGSYTLGTVSTIIIAYVNRTGTNGNLGIASPAYGPLWRNTVYYSDLGTGEPGTLTTALNADGVVVSIIDFDNDVYDSFKNGSANSTVSATKSRHTLWNNTPWKLNQRGTNSEYLNGDCCEVIVYNSALSTADRNSVEDYLNGKWAIY